MNKAIRALGLLLLGVGFAVLLAHGLRVYRIQSGLAELKGIRQSMSESASTSVEQFEQHLEYAKIREEYREKGISHPDYEEAYNKSPKYYGAGLVLVVVGAGMFRFSRKSDSSQSSAESEAPRADESHTEGAG